MAFAGETIGLLGGSFNPAHAGHAQISDIALARLGLDRIWWLVSPGNPLKDPADLAALDHRVADAKHVAGMPRITVTAFEADLPTPFTAATLTVLLARYPGVRFVWLMGADSLAGVHRWRAWRSIFERVPVAVIDRPGWHLRAMAGPAARTFLARRVPEQAARLILSQRLPAWTFLTGPLNALSSTAIRASRQIRSH